MIDDQNPEAEDSVPEDPAETEWQEDLAAFDSLEPVFEDAGGGESNFREALENFDADFDSDFGDSASVEGDLAGDSAPQETSAPHEAMADDNANEGTEDSDGETDLGTAISDSNDSDPFPEAKEIGQELRKDYGPLSNVDGSSPPSASPDNSQNEDSDSKKKGRSPY